MPLQVSGYGFPLELTGPATYSLDADGGPVTVRAERPLALLAEASVEALPMRLATGFRAHGLGIERGVRAFDPVVVGIGVEVSLDVDALVGVRLPLACNALALGPPSTATSGVAIHTDQPTHMTTGPGAFPLSATPTGAPFATLTVEVETQFRVVGFAGTHAHVVRELDHGVLDGWIDGSRLTPVAPGTGWTMWGSSSGCGGSIGFGRGIPSGLVYEGPAVLRRGAVIRGSEGVVVARATDDVTVRVAVLASPEEPVLLWEIDGLTSNGRPELSSGLTTSRDDLVLPAGLRLPVP